MLDVAEASPGRLRDIETVAKRYSLGEIRAVASVAESVLNENYRLETASGTWFVRFVQKKRTRAIVEAEHRALAHVHEQGVPVALAREMPGGRTVTSIGGNLAAVFPWIAGRTGQRGSLTAVEARAIGDVHGQTVQALATYHDDVLEARAPGETDWDTTQSIADLSRVDDLIRYYPAPPDDQLAAQAALRMQLGLLESGEPRPAADFDSMPRQLEHGDFHERNVIFDGRGRVAAVVDWERIRVLPRAFQLVRALDFTGLLADGGVDDYLSGYCRRVALQPGEGTMAVEQWWQSVLHNTWTFTEVFIRGNEPVRRFVPEVGPRLGRLRDESFRRDLAETVERHARKGEIRADG